MDYICQQYIKQIKLLLPAKTQNEKNYLKHLYQNLKEYCEENEITSLEELYQSYGNPAELVQAYLSWIFRCGGAASPAWREPPVRTNRATFV